QPAELVCEPGGRRRCPRLRGRRALRRHHGLPGGTPDFARGRARPHLPRAGHRLDDRDPRPPEPATAGVARPAGAGAVFLRDAPALRSVVMVPGLPRLWVLALALVAVWTATVQAGPPPS